MRFRREGTGAWSYFGKKNIGGVNSGGVSTSGVGGEVCFNKGRPLSERSG